MYFGRKIRAAAAGVFAALAAGATWAGLPAKAEIWTEVKSPHFVVYTNASPKDGRRTADQFEQVRALFLKLMGKARADAAEPIVILAVKNESGLRELLPQFYEAKGRFHPDGIFQAGDERNYVVLRLDAPEESAHEVLYHEYTHFLVRLNYGALPVWLSEGLAEFYGHTRIGEKEVIVGQASRSHLLLLRESKLLPLDSLFAAGHDSSLYNERNKASLFYAESWAMVHYLMLGDRHAHGKELSEYIRLVLTEHMDQLEAAHRCFGDPTALSKAIEDYARRQSFYQMKMSPPTPLEDTSYPSRPISEAESLAARGNFLAYSNRPEEARPLLSQAAAQEPRLASPHEGLGLLALEAGDYDTAENEFARAVELDSHSALAYCLSARAALRHGGASLAAMKNAEAQLRKAVEINADLAQAHAELGLVLMAERTDLDEALQHALRAAALQPGDPDYLLNAGMILIQLNRFDDAEKIGTRALAQAVDPAQTQAAQAFLESARRAAEWQRLGVTSSKGAHGGVPATPSASESIPEEDSPRRASKGLNSPSGPLRFRGLVTESSCTGLVLNLTVTGGDQSLRLRVPNYMKVQYEASGWEPPGNFSPCRHLRGRTIFATYKQTSPGPPDGEVTAIQVVE